jgi:hypothetical protein
VLEDTFTFPVPWYLARRHDVFGRSLDRRVEAELYRRGVDPHTCEYSCGIAGCQVTVTIKRRAENGETTHV